jgi:phenylalanyl-tRNA synthetase beta chain
LTSLGFACEVGVDSVLVEAPSYRLDVSIPADLVEEVARVYGYHNIPSTRMTDELPPQFIDRDLQDERHVRDTLVACDLYEAITYGVTSLEAVATFDGKQADPDEYLQLENPLTPERSVMRRDILPELLAIAATNLHERERVAMFEVGHVFHQGAELLPAEPRHLAVVMAGLREPRSWHTPEPPVLEFWDLKGVLDALLRRFNLTTRVEWAPARDERFHPGRSAILRVAANANGSGEQVIGIAGELHPATRDRMGFDAGRVCAAELDLDTLLGLKEPVEFNSILRQPAINQDIAVIVPDEVAADRVRTTIAANAGPLLERVELFDVYTGAPIPAGQRSLAYRMTFRAPDRTLEDAEVSKLREKVARRLETELGATIRA